MQTWCERLQFGALLFPRHYLLIIYWVAHPLLGALDLFVLSIETSTQGASGQYAAHTAHASNHGLWVEGEVCLSGALQSALTPPVGS